MIIGISGKNGTGKSHVVKFLKKRLGFEVIDAEKIFYNLLEDSQIKSELTKTYGEGRLLHPNGTIDRNKIIMTAYNNPINLDVFRSIIEPEITKQIRNLLIKPETNYIVDVTNPERLKISNFFNVSVLVTTPKKLGFMRLRRKFPHKIVENIWNWQKDTKKYDFVIENAGSIKQLKADVDELVREMLKS